MALDKNSIQIPFGQGVDTKTDSKQVPVGKLLNLKNAVFNTGGELQKRNGFNKLSTLPAEDATTLTTASGNLVATGKNLYAYSADTDQWLNQGMVQPVSLSVQALVRDSESQTTVDSVTHSNGMSFTVYTDASGSYYQVYSEALVVREALPATANQPRCFILGRYFIVTFIATVLGSPHLQYIAVPINRPDEPTAATDISTQIDSLTAAYDGFVANNNLYLSWNGSDGGGAIRSAYMTQVLVLNAASTIPGENGDLISVTADTSQSTPVIWVSWWDDTSNDLKTAAYGPTLLPVLSTTVVSASIELEALTSIATDMAVTLYCDIQNDYSYAAIRTDYLSKVSVTQAGSVGSFSTFLRSVGLASKPFYGPEDETFMWVAYGGSLQPSYFLINDSGDIIAKLAYSNGIGFPTTQILPQVSVNDGMYSVGYLIKDTLQPVNKTQGSEVVSAVYASTGVNRCDFTINTAQQHSSDIAGALHLTGGMIWEYDSVQPVEHSFHVWPEDVDVTTSASGGFLTAQEYFYVATYEWTDAAGQLHRSAPSIPFSITTTGSTSSNTVNIPTLRLTYKPNARIVIYRWSVAQQTYYQVTSITSPLINDPTVDQLTYVDTLADSSIIGNTILYTTGGVVENIAAPASDCSALFKSRMFVLDSSNKNLLWYSKQVIEETPVEFSDLFTLYVAPTTGAQGSTGPITALSAMDDKLIIFKSNAIYYLTGTGPDNTGKNNDFTDPVFVTSTSGCNNQNSIVFTPLGIMAQSNKGIWLLKRDLGTEYIGADVEAYVQGARVNSAVVVPGTNQVRFVLDTGITLMYDYYYGQWGVFDGIPAISSTLYNGQHTILNSFNLVLQETPGSYLDNSNPVLMSLTTSWIKLLGLQGFQRAYYFFLLGSFVSSHRLNIGISYDFNPSKVQTIAITPINTTTTWGSDPSWGALSPWGGGDLIEQWRVFFSRQKCQSVQISIDELQGSAEGSGLTLSGLNFVIGGKKSYPKLPAKQSVG